MERRDGWARGGGGEQREAKAPLRERDTDINTDTHAHPLPREAACARASEGTRKRRPQTETQHSDPTPLTRPLPCSQRKRCAHAHTCPKTSLNALPPPLPPLPPRRARRRLGWPSPSLSSFPHHGHPPILSMASRATMRENKRRGGGGEGGGGAGTKLRREKLWRRVGSPPSSSFKSTPARKIDKDHEPTGGLLLRHLPTAQGRRCCV